MNSASLFSLGLISLTLAPPLRAVDVSPVSMDVKEVSQDKRTRTDESQNKSLNVQLTNSSAADLAVKVKYYFFARNATSKEVAILKDGEKSATIKAHGAATVQTESVAAKFVEKHAQGGGRGKAGKEIPASGKRIVGYGVQVRLDGKLLCDTFTEPSLKTYVTGN